MPLTNEHKEDIGQFSALQERYDMLNNAMDMIPGGKLIKTTIVRRHF